MRAKSSWVLNALPGARLAAVEVNTTAEPSPAITADPQSLAAVSPAEVPAMVRDGRLPIDVALVQVAPPDSDGMCSLGISVDATKEVAPLVSEYVHEPDRRGRRADRPPRLDHR